MGKQAESEGTGTTACDGEAEGLGKDRVTDAEPHQPGNTRGAREQEVTPVGSPPSPHGQLRARQGIQPQDGQDGPSLLAI